MPLIHVVLGKMNYEPNFSKCGKHIEGQLPKYLLIPLIELHLRYLVCTITTQGMDHHISNHPYENRLYKPQFPCRAPFPFPSDYLLYL